MMYVYGMTNYPNSLKLQIAAAAKLAEQIGGEGPYGLYDYSSYYGDTAPHVVRDFRNKFRTGQYGAHVFSSYDEKEAQAKYEELTNIHIGEVILEVMHQYMATGGAIGESEFSD